MKNKTNLTDVETTALKSYAAQHRARDRNVPSSEGGAAMIEFKTTAEHSCSWFQHLSRRAHIVMALSLAEGRLDDARTNQRVAALMHVEMARRLTKLIHTAPNELTN